LDKSIQNRYLIVKSIFLIPLDNLAVHHYNMTQLQPLTIHRLRKNISGPELAEKLGVHFSIISRFERGIFVRRGFDFYKQYAIALDLTLDQLYELWNYARRSQ
jgi:hypothetical protein